MNTRKKMCAPMCLPGVGLESQTQNGLFHSKIEYVEKSSHQNCALFFENEKNFFLLFRFIKNYT